MSEFTDLLLAYMDPVNALLQVCLGIALLWVRNDLHDDLKRLRGRVRRVEGVYIPDGGCVDDEEDDE